MDIKRSLTLRFLLLVAILLGISLMVVYQNYAEYRNIDYQERFAERINSHARIIIDLSPNDSLIQEALRVAPLRPMMSQQIAIVDENNTIITPDSTKYLIDSQLVEEIQDKKSVYKSKGNIDVLGLTLVHNNKNYVVIAKATDMVGKKKLNYLRKIVVITFCIGLILASLFGWYFSSQALKPLQDVLEEANSITANNLYTRLKVQNPHDEIGRLSATFNQMLDRLESSFVMEKNFVSNASHEFRTPVTAIKAQIEVMLMQDRNKEEYVATLKSIGEDIDNFIQLMTSLSELANANLSSEKLKISTVPIIEIVDDARSEILRSKTPFRVDLQILTLPEKDEENYISGSASLLKSAFKNLIENACKFSPDLYCQISVDFEPNFAVVKVIDSGTGIAEEDLKHIFEPFYRANDTRVVAGHGIGLSLVKKIIEMHNGLIEVESELSVGTTMIIKLPYAKKEVIS
jgi:signal transduction histidine kinase